MAWVRLHDGYYDNPKVAAVGMVAEALWIRSIAYANRNETDGYLSRRSTASLTVDRPRGVTTAALIDALLSAGLWEAVDGGYRIHDFHHYQPSKSENDQRRANTKAKVAKWRAEHPPSRNGYGNPVTQEVTDDEPW